ncbi:MAG: putative porin [Desulfatitalea sp.]|nr:putative porin [Desulfatitalea sp.]
MTQRTAVSICIFYIVLFLFPTGLWAEENSSKAPDDSTRTIIQLLKEKGIITETEALGLLQQLALETEGGEVEEPVTKEDLNNLKERSDRVHEAMMVDHRFLQRRVDDMEEGPLNSLLERSVKTEWAQRIAFSADVRLRYQGDYFAEGNALFLRPDDTSETLNSTEDRHRLRYRARIGMKAKLLDYREVNVGKMEAGFRFTTGNEKDPLSTNETMGDYLNRDSFVFDRAYLKYAWQPINPKWNRMPRLSLFGGRFANPWFSSDLVWDSDLNLEGAAIGYETDTEQMRPLNMFVTAGIFPLQEEELTGRNKWFWGAQLGFTFQPRYDLAFVLGAAYYDYQRIEGVQNELSQPGVTDYTAPLFQQKGNTLMDIDPTSSIETALATDYNILDIYLTADFGIFYPVQIVLEGQYVKNLGFDSDRVALVTTGLSSDELARVPGIEEPIEDTDGYMVGATIGYPKIYNQGEWNVGFKYKYLGADAVIDAFTDSDFHLGGTNAKGWIFKIEYGLYRNVWLTSRWLSSNEIKGPPFGVDTLQVDINARF